MNILIIGSGGREHAFAWKLANSSLCSRLFMAPGNAGTAALGTNLPIQSNDPAGIIHAIKENDIRMVVIGPEDPLVNGLTDKLIQDPSLKELHVIGPGASGARLEGSKSFAKAFMKKYGIPTAAYQRFSKENLKEGFEYLHKHSLPVVLKADGLAAGKGVLICDSHEEAVAELEKMISQDKFGKAGQEVVVEEFLKGIEVSVFILTDGNDFLLLPEAKDYKRIGEGDTGLNTGGMGAVSPVPFFTEDLKKKIVDRIIIPTLHGLKSENIPYKGFIFFGLMISGGEPFVIEYNCRMGDPETQTVLPRIKNDLVELFLAVSEGRVKQITSETENKSAVTIVAVSRGYPGSYEIGKPIHGLQQPLPADSFIFQAGTVPAAGEVKTAGGRVLAATSLGESISMAASRSISVLTNLQFEGLTFRKDIGYEFMDTGKS
jgi:phosphoribosylamine--glycine ligase